MPFYSCCISLADGTVIATDVNVAIESGEPDGKVSWHGTIFAHDRTPLNAGQRYRLELGDGRRGEFMVRRNTVAGDENRVVAIHGLGPLAVDPRPNDPPPR